MRGGFQQYLTRRGVAPRESYLAEEFNMTGIIPEGLRFRNSLADEKENDSPARWKIARPEVSQRRYPRLITRASLANKFL